MGYCVEVCSGYCVEVCSGILCRGVYIVGYCVEVCI